MEYYLHTHVPRVDEASGTALKAIAVDQGICGRGPGSSSDYAAIGPMYFDSVDAYRMLLDHMQTGPAKAGPSACPYSYAAYSFLTLMFLFSFFACHRSY